MKFALAPYTLTLRRARHLHVVLFGAFVYAYTSVLQGERILAFLHDRGIDTFCSLPLVPWMVGIPCTLIALGAALLWRRSHHMPPTWSGQRRLAAMVLLAFVVCLVTSPSENDVLEQKMERLNRQEKHDACLDVSRNYAHPTSGILEQRILALTATGQLYEDFFTLPLAPDSLMLNLDGCPEELALLLHRDLDGFARLLKARIDSAPHALHSLQRAEWEALVLYNHRRANPIIVTTDPRLATEGDACEGKNIEANYRDFCDYEQKATHNDKHYTPLELANVIGEVYGDTYWHYFFYGQYR